MKALAPRLVLAALAAAFVLAVPAAADSNKAILKDNVTPSLPTDVSILGVKPGGVPWVIDKGEARVKPDGRVRARVEGLVVPSSDPAVPSTNPVPTLAASVFCNGSTTPAATTMAVPFSPAGDARIDERVTLPATCADPVVLLNPAGNVARYIGSAGFFTADDDD
jgi:hypothetical protein